MTNMLNVGFNENSHKATAFEKALRDIRRELKVKKGGEVSGGDMIIPLPFRCCDGVSYLSRTRIVK